LVLKGGGIFSQNNFADVYTALRIRERAAQKRKSTHGKVGGFDISVKIAELVNGLQNFIFTNSVEHLAYMPASTCWE